MDMEKIQTPDGLSEQICLLACNILFIEAWNIGKIIYFFIVYGSNSKHGNLRLELSHKNVPKNEYGNH